MSIDPPSWSGLELDVLRIGLALAVFRSLWALRRSKQRRAVSHPVGWARIVPIGWMDRPSARHALHGAAGLALAGLVVDRATPLALAVLAGVLLLEVTHDNSAGAGGHAHHLVTAVTFAQLAAELTWRLADAAGWEPNRLLLPTADATASWWSVQTIVAIYFVSGVEKLLNTGGRWVHRAPGLLVRAMSLRTQARMRSGGRRRLVPPQLVDDLLAWLAPRPRLARLLFGGGLAIELLAPVGLLGETPLLLVGVALLALHLANGAVLGLPFVNWQLLVFVFLVNPVRAFA